MYLENVWKIVASSRTKTDLALDSLPEDARRAIASALQDVMDYYCGVEKPIYCDKSLDSAPALAALDRTLPDTRYILQFRHPMDAVASGLEASPWGFARLGYLPFVQQSPDNLVAALTMNWLSTTDAMLEWERVHGDRCCRIKYEELVTDPVMVFDRAVACLGARPGVLDIANVLDAARGTPGPSDYKIAFTTAVATNSIGRGRRIPVDLLNHGLLEALNRTMLAVGYDPIDDGWNAEVQRAGSAWPSGADGELERLMSTATVALPPGRDLGPFAIVADNDPRLRWIVDPSVGAITKGDGDVETGLIGHAEDLVGLIRGDDNAGVLVRSGRVRQLNGTADVTATELATNVHSILIALTVETGGERRP